MLLWLCRHPSQWAGVTFAAQRESAALCEEADGFQHLRSLDIRGMSFNYNVAMPPALESAVLLDVSIEGAVWLDKCRCATACAHWGQGDWAAFRPC